MSIYTPPALNAVNFELTAFTPANTAPYEIALSAYTVPALNAVDFALTAYSAPNFPAINFELLDSGVQSINGTSFENLQTFGAATITSDYEIVGESFTNPNDFGSGIVAQSGDTISIYDGDYVDKHFVSQYLKKKKKEQELLEQVTVFPSVIEDAPAIVEDDEPELMMIFAELFYD